MSWTAPGCPAAASLSHALSHTLSYDSPVRQHPASFAGEDGEARGRRGTHPRSERSTLTVGKPWLLCVRPPFHGCELRVKGHSLPLNQHHPMAGEIWSQVRLLAGKEFSTFATLQPMMREGSGPGRGANWSHDFWGRQRAGARPQRERWVHGITKRHWYTD